MKTSNTKNALPFLILVGLSSSSVQAESVATEAKRFKDAYQEAEPVARATEWLVPFATSDRKKISSLKVVSVFGAKRISYKKGHFHSGTDLVPKSAGRGPVVVYPLAAGVVCSIHLGKPHTTVVIKHRLLNGNILYSSYKHLAKIYVGLGQQVKSGVRLGRLFTKVEARQLGGSYDHLHLEIRKKFDDFGVASWLTMTKTELTKRFVDPYPFLRQRLVLRPSQSSNSGATTPN